LIQCGKNLDDDKQYGLHPFASPNFKASLESLPGSSIAPLRHPSNLAPRYWLVHQLRRRQICRPLRPTGSWNITGPAGQIHRDTDTCRTTRSRCTSDAAQRGSLRGFTSSSISPRVIVRNGKEWNSLSHADGKAVGEDMLHTAELRCLARWGDCERSQSVRCSS
jgi:hypothetical protein